MKSVLISIQPKWVEKICKKIGEENGKPIYKKRIEVRKGRPNEPTPIKCLIYCTYGQLLYADYPNGADSKVIKLGDYKVSGKDKIGNMLNGKVIGEFVCDWINEFYYDQAFDESMGVFLNSFGYEIMSGDLEQTCLSYEEFEKYGNMNTLYGWHISDLKIYDKPKELSEFWTIKCTNKRNGCQGCKVKPNCIKTITRPPQSWCYIDV